MEFAKELARYLESTPELHGQKLMLIRSFCQVPVTAEIAEEGFYDWAIEGMELMMNEYDLNPNEVEVSVCREIAKVYATKELKKIKAGAYKELDIMMREALESSLRPGTKVQIRQDGKAASGKFGTIMEDETFEILPTDPLVSEDEVRVRLDDNRIVPIPINRLDVVEASTIFVAGADPLPRWPVRASADEKYTTDVEVEMSGNGLPPGIPEGSYFPHNQKILLKWEMWIEARDWGIKGMSPMLLPNQEFELKFEEPTDDEDIEHSFKWKLGDWEVEWEQPEPGNPISFQILPTTISIDFTDNTATVTFGLS